MVVKRQPLILCVVSAEDLSSKFQELQIISNIEDANATAQFVFAKGRKEKDRGWRVTSIRQFVPDETQDQQPKRTRKPGVAKPVTPDVTPNEVETKVED